MKRTILLLATLLLACGAINAQNLVFHDVRDLVEDSNAPKFAIFTEEYYNSLEWFDLSQRIDNYSYAKAAEEMSLEIVQAKKDIAEAKARGENVEFMEEKVGVPKSEEDSRLLIIKRKPKTLQVNGKIPSAL